MTRSVHADGITLTYTLMQTARRNVLVKVLPDGEFRAYAPASVPLREVDAVVRAHMPELMEMRDELMNAIRVNRAEHPVRPGSRICIEGRPHLLCLEKAARTTCVLEGDTLTLRLSAPDDEERVRAALRQILSEMALEKLRVRLDYYAPILGVHYGRVTVREQKTRWGSCSAKHNLNFNWKLIMAPAEVLDYVAAHELCHLKEFNHSPRFWALVGSVCPEYESCKKWLKLHGKELGV